MDRLAFQQNFRRLRRELGMPEAAADVAMTVTARRPYRASLSAAVAACLHLAAEARRARLFWLAGAYVRKARALRVPIRKAA